jgi:hypothetical protein
MKIAFGMIVFEGDFVLKECLEQVYPFASQILISEGPVKYWQDLGKSTSEDNTNNILDNFPDPDNKITIVHGQFSEKDEQSNAYMSHLNKDTDYLWMIDSDEVYRTEDIVKAIEFLSKMKPTSVGVQSCSFYGGFDHYLTGFEEKTDNFLRIFKVTPNSTWLTHRPPTIKYENNIQKLHINSSMFYQLTGVKMYHYSYVFPEQVRKKIDYYKAKVSKDNCIDNYFNDVYLPWVLSSDENKKSIEQKYLGVHEFKPHVRGECYTSKFNGQHPESIIKSYETLKLRFNNELKKYVDDK